MSVSFAPAMGIGIASNGQLSCRSWSSPMPEVGKWLAVCISIRMECVDQHIVWSHWWRPKPSDATTAHHRKRDRTQVELRMGNHQVHDHEDGTVQQIDAILHLGPIDLAIPCCPAMNQ